jgi:hypothetical protein
MVEVGNDMVKFFRLYLTHPTFFSELTAVPPATLHDEYWHEHVDKVWYQYLSL